MQYVPIVTTFLIAACACSVALSNGLDAKNAVFLKQTRQLELPQGFDLKSNASKPLQSTHGSDALTAGDLSKPVQRGCEHLQSGLPDEWRLGDVLARVLCQSPAMQIALAQISEQEALVDLADTAYRPRITANSNFSLLQSPATQEFSERRSRSLGLGLALNWVIFDFGLRDANLAQARANLQAAWANQSSAALVQLSDSLRLYGEALAVHSRLGSLRSAELAAEQSLDIAQARYKAQVGGLSEQLQAETALAQAKLERLRAEGQWQSARGALAVALGLDVRQNLDLAPISHAFPNSQSLESQNFSDLQKQLKAAHPRLNALQAEQTALRERLNAQRAEGRGSVSLGSSASLNKGLGGTSGTDLLTTYGASISANIPLLNGAEQSARERQIATQLIAKQAQLDAQERELDIELWRSLQQLRSELSNLDAARSLVQTATQSHQIALGRYKAGVSSVQELLFALSARSNALSQLSQAEIGYAQSRIRLALAGGQMNGLTADSFGANKTKNRL